MVKIDRNPIPPPSLEVEKKKANGLYNKADVIQQLKKEAKYDDKIIDCCVDDPEEMLEQCYENRHGKD